MSKGLKMEAANKKDKGSTIFNISQLSKNDNGNLICQYCSCKVQYVSAHKRNASKTPVSAYLKLWQGKEHLPECSYNVKVAVNKLVANSQAIENLIPIFQQEKDGSFVFRMNLLNEAQCIAKKISLLNGESPEEDQKAFSGSKYVRTQKDIATYFRSASGVVKLRGLIQESSDVELLKSLIKIQFKDRFINWDDFYYDESRYHILFNRLLRSSLTYPIALKVTVKYDWKHSAKAKKFPWSFQCYSETMVKDERKIVYVPKLQISNDNILGKIKKGSTYLVIGEIWGNKTFDSENVFRNVNISIYNKLQIKKDI